MKHLRQYIRQHLILELRNRPPENIDELLKHADSVLESSTFFDDMPDLVLKELLQKMAPYHRSNPTRRIPPVDWQLKGNRWAHAENILQAKIITKSISRFQDPYNLRGYNPDHNPMGFKTKIPNNTFITSDATKKAILDLIYGKPGYADALEAVRGYMNFNNEIIEWRRDPDSADPDMIPVYEIGATQNRENFKQAHDLWDMMR